MEAKSVNPATGELLAVYPFHSDEAVHKQLDASADRFETWAGSSFTERSDLLMNLATLLDGRKRELARLMTIEMGKPIRQARGEIEKCAWVCRYYAEHGRTFLEERRVTTEPGEEAYVHYQPLGVILAVMPWNFPFWQVIRFAAPTLMAGNVAILKHASNVTGCAYAMESLFLEAGFPEDAFRTIVLPGDKIEKLIMDTRIAGVSLTGSVGAGKSVGAAAGRALKPSVLELGGSDPYIILEDADIATAARVCVDSRLINSGQSCIAAKRFIVVRDVRAAFEQEFKRQLSSRKLGDPMDEATEVGPLARADLRDDLQRLVSRSQEKGARCVLGGSIPGGPGYYYPATLLTDVNPNMPAYHEETFGPVAALIEVADENEAVRVANASRFGLGAAVFTNDRDRALRLCRYEIDAGAVFANAAVKSDPRLPFGGIKESGYGRELGREGMLSFVNTKSVLFRSI